jgi:hypothetical protein
MENWNSYDVTDLKEVSTARRIRRVTKPISLE